MSRFIQTRALQEVSTLTPHCDYRDDIPVYRSLPSSTPNVSIASDPLKTGLINTMPTARANVNGVVLAETDTWETVEGNVYVR